MATIDTIKTILEENLDIDPSTVEESSTFDSLGIDSLDMVELICDLEEPATWTSANPRASTPWAASWSTSTRCKRDRARSAIQQHREGPPIGGPSLVQGESGQQKTLRERRLGRVGAREAAGGVGPVQTTPARRGSRRR